MDGSQVTTIISGTDVVTPTALAIDAATRTLFWADFTSKRVESVTFSGSRTLIYQSMNDNYLRLSVDSNYIYLSTLFSRGVTRLSRSGGDNPVLLGQQQFTCLYDILYAGTTTSTTTATMTATTRPTSTATTAIIPTSTTTAIPITTTTTITSTTTTTTIPTTTTTATIPTRTTATPTATLSTTTADTPLPTTTTLATSTTVPNPTSTTLGDETTSTSTAISSADTNSPAAAATATAGPWRGESASPPILPTMYIIIVGVVVGGGVVIALIVAFTVCIVKKKKRQATSAARHNPKQSQPPKPDESPFAIYDTIGHNHAKPDSPHQHRLARDNSYVNAPEPHYIVLPKNVGQPDDTYDRLVFPLNPVTGVSNAAYDATPSDPPPAYTPPLNEPLNY